MERKIYNRTYWVDHETPVNAENLNKLEKGLQELSELSLRPSDFMQKEDSPISIDINCGIISFDLNSTVIRGDSSVKKLKVVRDYQDIDETDSELCIYMNEDNSYKLFYGGFEYKYIPTDINSNMIVCSTGDTIEDFIQNSDEKVLESVSDNLNDLDKNIEKRIKDLETVLQNKIDSLQKKVNTLSLKIDMLNDKIKEMEDKNNGLEIM